LKVREKVGGPPSGSRQRRVPNLRKGLSMGGGFGGGVGFGGGGGGWLRKNRLVRKRKRSHNVVELTKKKRGNITRR